MAVVLVVEDESIIAEDVGAALTELGYEVAGIASTGDDALALTRSKRPDLILMDINLRGGADGIATATAIRDEVDVPVVFLTSYSDERTLARAKGSRPHGYLLKPFSERELRTTIEVALHRHALEKQLAKRHHLPLATLRSVGDAVIATDANEQITFLNGAAERMTGWDEKDALGQPLGAVLRLVDPEGAPHTMTPVGRALESGAVTEIPPGTALLTKDGTAVAIDDSAAPILDELGMIVGGVVVFRDVTERRELETRFHSAERLASLGTMVAGVGHELNNPLTSVVANLGFALEEVRRLESAVVMHGAYDDEPSLDGDTGVQGVPEMPGRLRDIRDALAEAQVAVDRVRGVMAEFKRFSGPRGTLRRVDIGLVLDRAAEESEEVVHEHAVLVRSISPVPTVIADEETLVRVIATLLSNAAHACRDRILPSGTHHAVRLSAAVDHDGAVRIEVKDSGLPLTARDLAHAFDPFYTPKRGRDSVGLGLTACHHIVAGLGGEIGVRSEASATTFSIRLPAEGRRESFYPPPHGTPTRLLVVDDDPAIGRALARSLRDDCEVDHVVDAQAAVAKLATGSYDAILCAVDLPEAAGREIYEALVVAAPPLASRIVFMTGGMTGALSTAFLATTPVPVLTKPFTRDTVRRAVRSVLAEHRAA